ncbi:MAG: DNA polymerase III subunit beta [Acidobacteria bacterium]|nr:MAG: DNA polymerase III subunit beta [Acidobacteriota bacterium]
MEFTAAKSALLKELNLTQGVVEKKTTIPILSNLLLEVSDSTLRISATDLELGVRCGCSAKVKKEGSGTVPAKRLLEIVRSLPEAEVKFKVLENHWVQLNCERSSFKLVGMARDNFPSLPEVPKAIVTIPCGVFTTMIQKTIFAISSEESRYTLNGALLLLKPESVTMVATDGHRLALIERQMQVAGLKNELRFLIPKKAMGELLRLLAECEDDAAVEFSKDETHLFFSAGDRVLISRMLTGQFPFGEAREVLDAPYQNEALEIGFNYQYLLDFFNAVTNGGKVRLEFKDEQSAGQFRPSDEGQYQYRYVVMPMRL